MKLVGNSWDIELEDETSKPYFMELLEKVDKEYQNHVVYPKQHNVFNALKYTPFENIKVVILGQDPYHGAGQAHGLCFSVQPGVEPPPSLKNIYKEIENDIGCKMSNSGYLASWAKQGVLLLNTILTVEEGKPQSHKNFGWQQWTDAIIKKISDKKSGVVFLLWGRNAIDKKTLINSSKHLVLTAPHPSPLSAYNGFFGCKHFSKCNDYLISLNKQPIDWQIN